MKIAYDVVRIEPDGKPDHLECHINSKREALRSLARWRREYPEAYLLRFVETRVRA